MTIYGYADGDAVPHVAVPGTRPYQSVCGMAVDVPTVQPPFAPSRSLCSGCAAGIVAGAVAASRPAVPDPASDSATSRGRRRLITCPECGGNTPARKNGQPAAHGMWRIKRVAGQPTPYESDQPCRAVSP